MKTTLVGCLIGLAVLGIQAAYAQPGRIDNSFNVFEDGLRGSGFDGELRCSHRLADGRLLVGGLFNGFSGTIVGRLMMLNADGSRDTGFALAGTGFNSTVNAVQPYPGGKWVVGGDFSTYNASISRRGIALLNTNGSIDAGFTPATSLAGGANINAVAVQPDGKILIGGSLTRTGSPTRYGIIRLEPNGALDASFGTGSGIPAGTEVNSILLLPDGDIIIGGNFNTYDGTTVGRLCRLNADGSLDAGFNGGGSRFSTVGTVQTLLAMPGGAILAGGSFDAYNGINSSGLVRLQSNGDIDNSFTSPYNSGPTTTVRALAQHPDGSRIWVGGLLGATATGRHIALLSAAGAIDASFTAPLLLSTVTTVAALPDGGVFIGNGINAASTFTNGPLVARLYANRLLPSGSADASFMQSSGVQSFGTSVAGITAIAVLPDDAVILGSAGGFAGSSLFRYYNDVGRRGIARLQPDGQLDVAFNADSGAVGVIHSIAPDPATGRAVVVGDFTRFQSQARQSIVRLLPSGAIDNSFTATGPAVAGGTNLRAVRRLSDGRWLVAGQFKTFNGQTSYYLTRLTVNGAIDPGFAANANSLFDADGTGSLFDLQVLPDGRILAAGSIGSLSGTGGVSRPWVKMLSANGQLVPAFDPAFASNTGSINAVAALPDGRVAIAGSFRLASAPASTRVVAVLLPNGALDTSWAGTTRISGVVNRLLVTPNGELLLGGQNITYNDAGTNRTRQGLMLLNNAGLLVPTSFTADAGNETNAGIGSYYSTEADPFVEAMAFQNDGKLLVGGNFRRYGGRLAHGIVRVLMGPADPAGLTRVCAGSSFTLEAPLTGASYQWQANNGSGWSNLADNSIYAGTATATLQFNSTPSSLYGFQYRCLVDAQPSAIVATLRFESVWTGAIDDNWSNAANWSCGIVPDANTDVVVRFAGSIFLQTNAAVRSLRLQQGANLETAPGVSLQVLR